ncbi:MAG: calcium-binding protein [Cyanobacteria bacterium J06643_5]
MTYTILPTEDILSPQPIKIPDTILYSKQLGLKNYGFSFKTADYLNRWTSLRVKNEDTYDSENNFISKFNWDGKRHSLFDVSAGIGKAKVGANARLDLAPGSIEAGLQLEAGYNLGEFDINLPFSGGVEAGIVNNQFTIDVNANFAPPKLNYTLPHVYAYLDAVLGYDIKADIYGEAFAEIDYWLGKKRASAGGSFNLADAKGKIRKRLVQLDTRKDDNFIDLIYKKINLGKQKEASVSRAETKGYLEIDFDLPRFNGSFKPLDGSFSDLRKEYLWGIQEEKEIVDVDFSIDNLLAQIPVLSWMSQAGEKKYNVLGRNVGLEYDWRALALDLSASISYGYKFKTGFTDLLPKINREKSEIQGLLDSSKSTVDKLTSNYFADKEELVTALLAADKDNDLTIDIVVDFNPKIVFDAEVYLKANIDLEQDIGVVKGKLTPIVNNQQEFTLLPGNNKNIYSNKIPIVNPTRKEVSFKNFYKWLRESNPSLPQIDTEYKIEIPFNAIDPERFPGTKGDDYIQGKDGDEGNKALGDGNDTWVFSTGKDGEIDGGTGFNSLKIVNPETYTFTRNTLSDSSNNITTYTNFISVEIDGTQSTTSGINISGTFDDKDSSFFRPFIFGAATDFNDKIESIDIYHLDTKEGDDIVRGNLTGTADSELNTGIGNDEITVSSIATSDMGTRIKAGAGDDKVNLTIVSPRYSGRRLLHEIDLGTGKDNLKVTQIASNSNTNSTLKNVELLVTGEIGGKTIDLELNPDNSSSEVVLDVRSSNIKDLFALKEDTEIDNLFIELDNSEITYKLDNNNPDATQIQDKIVKANKIRLDLTNLQIASDIKMNPHNFAASNLTIDGNNDLTKIVIDTKIEDIATVADVEINNVSSVKVNSVNPDFLQNKLLGDFRTLDLSEAGTGISLSEDFLSDSNNLDIFELVFTDEKDTIYFSPDASKVTSEGGLNKEIEATKELMSFNLGAGDDIFHDRAGLKNSSILPGLGNDFIYGEGGFDEVFYQEGSRFDYEITVIDDRTVEVLYKPDNTTDTLVDVERINFDGADDAVKNPYYKGALKENAYTTFNLQVSKAEGWQQPPFIFSPFTYFVPFGTKEVNLTKDLLLTNVYDPQGNEDQLEISYINTYTYSDSNAKLNTTEPDADVWQVNIPEGVNDETQPIVIDSMVDTPYGSSQGNYLEIYPSTELSYETAKAAINLTAFDKSESIVATNFDDTISSGSGDDTLQGSLGNDVLNGEAGNDNLEGGDGNDTLSGGSGNDNILGGLGNDFLQGNEGEDILEGGAGIDTLTGGKDSDILLGGDGDDVYISKIDESGGDIIQDSSGNDVIKLMNADDTEVAISLTQPALETIGISRMDDSLVIDINANGVLDAEQDLTVADFFNQSNGNGFIEQIANLSGDEIVNFLS